MKKLKLKQWLYMAGLLCMSVSCKEKLTGCDLDALCCDTADSGYGFVLVTKFENAPADYGNSALFFKNGFTVKELKMKYSQQSIPLCEHPDNIIKIKGLPTTTNYNDYANTPYKYRVWGRIFWAKDVSNITGLPVLRSQIDRIEKNN
jgi:hypothetical protein